MMSVPSNPGVTTAWIRTQARMALDEAEMAESRSREWWRWLFLDSPSFWARQARIWRYIGEEWTNIADDIEKAAAYQETMMKDENQFERPPMPLPDIVYRTKDHPEAMGRQPLVGEKGWRFSFLLEDNTRLEIRCGRVARDAFRAMFLQEDADDATERLLGG